MLSWTETLFYPIFLAQIALISWYLPGRMSAHMSAALEKYPPDQYPKLYPQSVDRYIIGQWRYRLVNNAIAIVGLVVVGLMLFVVDHSTFADDGFISEAWPAFYGMLQFLPLLFLEFSASGQMKLMRENNESTKRSADLQPRRLFDYVSPRLLLVAVIAALAAFTFEMALHDFVWSVERLQRLAILLLVNSFFLAIGYTLLRGRKPDPYQSSEDRARLVRRNLRSLLFTSVAISVFAVYQSLDSVYAIDYLDAVMMSLYFQVVAALSFGYLLHGQLTDDADFEVYRDASA